MFLFAATMLMQQQRQQQQSVQQTSNTSFMQQQNTQQQTMIQQSSSTLQSQQQFRVDTFEYRLVQEVEFRQAITQRSANEPDAHLPQLVQGEPLAPQIHQKPRSTKVAQGNNATFTTVLKANPTPRPTWFHNGERLRQGDKYKMTQTESGETTLVVMNVVASDSGMYTLLAENPSGATVASAQLAPVSEDITNGIQEHHMEIT